MPKKKGHDLDKNIVELIEHKLNFYANLCQKTLIHVERNKLQDIMSVSDLNQVFRQPKIHLSHLC